MTLPIRHRYLPYAEAAKVDNIVVDGGANDHTVLSLSHWPKSGTPKPLKADTSVEIVFRYLDNAAFHRPVEAVTNDHFDEDGLIALFVMVEPETALSMRDLLCDASHAGDFATYRSRQAARISFTLSTLADRSTSPLPKAAFPDAYPAYCVEMYARLVPMIAEIATATETYRDLWADEEVLLDDSERAIDSGEITLEEVADADLVVVRVPDTWHERPAHRFAQDRRVLCHPMAIHNRSRRNRVATVCGKRLSFGYRYESWVQMVNDPPPQRVDLHPLAAELSGLEPDGAWVFDGVEQITPALHLTNQTESAIDPERFLSMLGEALRTGAPAWDPYDAD
jgi:Family of unknown function (DUF6687)